MQVQIPCICPLREGGEQRHPQGDTVTLRPTLAFRDAAAIRYALGQAVRDDPDLGTPEFLGIVSEFYILGGVEAWSLLDEHSKPVAVTKDAIRTLLLTKADVAYVVADAADELYTAAVVLPLLQTASKSSQPTQTDASTSVKTSSSEDQPMPSKPSLTTTSQTEDTETTSRPLAGVSS